MDRPQWCREPAYATKLDRFRHQDKLDEHLCRWTAKLPANEVMERLQQAGVPASIVSQGEDLHTSPHLKARNFYRPTKYYRAERGKDAAQWEEGESIAWSMPVRMSRTPMEFGGYSNIGEDNSYVFEKLLAISPVEINRLASEKVMY